MGLLERKTPEEKEEARREKEEARARKAAEDERVRVERAAAAAAEVTRYSQFVATLPKWEYKVLTGSALAGWGSGTIEGLEPLLNQLAEEGWRVVTMSFTGQISQTLAADKNHLYVVLERPARYDGHAGAPVKLAPPPPPGKSVPMTA